VPTNTPVPPTNTPSATPIPLTAPTLDYTISGPKVTLSWNSISGATSYELWMSSDNGVTYILFTTSTSPYQVSQGNNKSNYYYYVVAVNSSTRSPNSNIAHPIT
jgi:hypothetical protein